MKFSLLAFPGAAIAANIEITGSIGRRANRLSIRYELQGDLSKLSIPFPEKTPSRKDRLWEDTCLELFLAARGSTRYWEFNFSPSGDWNAYRFSSYRKRMREERVFASIPVEVQRKPKSLVLRAEIDTGTLDPSGRVVEAAVCAVMRTKKGETSYWSLAHPCDRPDFHRREGFLLAISEK